MNCVILAGGRLREGDPLHQYANGVPKALIELGDKKLVEWVISALLDAQSVDEIAVVGLDQHRVREFDQEIHYLPDQNSLVSNALSGITWARQRDPDVQKLLYCTADIPAVTGALIDEHVALCRPFDKAAYYGFVTRQTMETRFPGADRTYARMDNQDVASCDLMVLQPELADIDRNLWESLTNARKHPWKVARVVGSRSLVRLLLGKMTFEEVEKTAQRILKIPVKVFLSDRAELAMDIDKLSHLSLMRSEFESSGRPA